MACRVGWYEILRIEGGGGLNRFVVTRKVCDLLGFMIQKRKTYIYIYIYNLRQEITKTKNVVQLDYCLDFFSVICMLRLKI